MSHKMTMTVTAEVEVSVDDMDCLLDDCTAGIRYWARWIDAVSDDAGRTISNTFRMTEDHEDEFVDGYVFTVDGDMWLKGLQRALDNGHRNWSAHRMPSHEPDDWDFDAFDHDVIIQYGLFGEQRYA